MLASEYTPLRAAEVADCSPCFSAEAASEELCSPPTTPRTVGSGASVTPKKSGVVFLDFDAEFDDGASTSTRDELFFTVSEVEGVVLFEPGETPELTPAPLSPAASHSPLLLPEFAGSVSDVSEPDRSYCGPLPPLSASEIGGVVVFEELAPCDDALSFELSVSVSEVGGVVVFQPQSPAAGCSLRGSLSLSDSDAAFEYPLTPDAAAALPRFVAVEIGGVCVWQPTSGEADAIDPWWSACSDEGCAPRRSEGCGAAPLSPMS